jgi:hypothetical protein
MIALLFTLQSMQGSLSQIPTRGSHYHSIFRTRGSDQRRRTSSRLDHGDGHVVDRLGRHGRLGLGGERHRRQGDVPQPREERRHGWLRELGVVADEHEQDVGHGGPDVGALLHAEQADVVAPPRLVLGVQAPQRRVHELGRAILGPQLPRLPTSSAS